MVQHFLYLVYAVWEIRHAYECNKRERVRRDMPFRMDIWCLGQSTLQNDKYIALHQLQPYLLRLCRIDSFWPKEQILLHLVNFIFWILSTSIIQNEWVVQYLPETCAQKMFRTHCPKNTIRYRIQLHWFSVFDNIDTKVKI